MADEVGDSLIRDGPTLSTWYVLRACSNANYNSLVLKIKAEAQSRHRDVMGVNQNAPGAKQSALW